MASKQFVPEIPAEDADEVGIDPIQAQLAALQQQVADLIAAKSAPASDDDRLEKILLRVAQMSADAHERAANPSNKTHPGISVYSRPKGDREDPRDKLKCEMTWIGYPLDTDIITDAEINLLNLAEPGRYQFRRTDESPETLTVIGDRGPDDQVYRLQFAFPVIENRETLPSMVSMLREAFSVKSPEQLELDALRAELATLKAKEGVAA